MRIKINKESWVKIMKRIIGKIKSIIGSGLDHAGPATQGQEDKNYSLYLRISIAIHDIFHNHEHIATAIYTAITISK